MIPNWEIQVLYIQRLIELAHKLDCKLIRIFTGMEYPDAPFSDQWDLIVRGIRVCCQKADKYDINIGIQNHHDIAVDAGSLSQLISEVDMPNCKAMFDAWVSSLQGEDVVQSIHTIKQDLVFTTVADYIKVPRYHYHPDLINYSRHLDRVVAVPMGEGFIDYTTFFDTLKAVGFDGYVSYEMCSTLKGGGNEANLDKYAKQFLKYMQKWK